MNHQQMQERCPGSRFLGEARLRGYTFVYDGTSRNGGAVANIIKANANAEVLGGLFEINADHLANLDKYEGRPTSYGRKIVLVRDSKGKACEAIVYYRSGKVKGKPSEEYRAIVVQGARDCGLPEQYIAENL